MKYKANSIGLGGLYFHLNAFVILEFQATVSLDHLGLTASDFCAGLTHGFPPDEQPVNEQPKQKYRNDSQSPVRLLLAGWAAIKIRCASSSLRDDQRPLEHSLLSEECFPFPQPLLAALVFVVYGDVGFFSLEANLSHMGEHVIDLGYFL